MTEYTYQHFYDRSIRLWTVTRHDEEGNQVGQAEYCPRKAEVEPLIKTMKADEPNQEGTY